MDVDAPGFFAGKHVVVFGAGYIGSAFVTRALAAGATVTALTRNPTTAATLAEAGARAIVADLAAADWHERVPRDADAILNCVGSGGGGVVGYQGSYVAGTTSILAWRGSGPLVYTSSTSVYPQDGGVLVDESAPTSAASSPNVARLLEAEALTAQWKPGATILRLAGIYGPGRHHLLNQLRSQARSENGGQPHVGSPLMSGVAHYHLNLIQRDDVVAAIIAAFANAEAAAGEVFNVADDGAATKADVVGWLAQQLGLPPPTFDGQPATGRRALTPDRIISNAKLKRQLGWGPRYPTFRQGYAALLGA